MPVARRTYHLQGTQRPDLAEARSWIGNRVTDQHGSGVGRLEDIWVDAHSGDPAWLLIREGRFGSRHKLVPFDSAVETGGKVWVPHERSTIRQAPEIGSEQVLTTELGQQLRHHYGIATRYESASAARRRQR
jgi:uncharacterized protein YrrD